MAGHYKFSASGAHKWMACPGQLRLCDGLERKPSFYMAEGTVAHALGEDALKRLDAKRPFTRIGEVIESDGFEVLVTREMAEAVNLYASTVLEELEELNPSYLGVEKHFNLSHIHPQLGGTNDASILAEFDKLVVYDYKHGAGVPVEVEWNPQFLIYALGALEGVDVETVEIVVVQPRCRFADGAVRRWQTTATEIREWAQTKLIERIKAVIAAELKPVLDEADLCPGEHCGFCEAKRKGVCPAHGKAVLSLATTAFKDYPPEPKEVSFTAPHDLTPEQLSRALSIVDIAEHWFKGVRNRVKEDLSAGKTIPGWKLVDGRPTRKWKTEAEERLRLIVKKPYKDPELRTPAQIEKLMKEDGMDKKTIAAKLSDLIETKRGVALAPESDKRPALPPTAVALFTNAEEGDE